MPATMRPVGANSDGRGAVQIGAPLALLSRIGIRHGMARLSFIRQFQRGRLLAMIVMNKIGRDTEQIIAAVRFILVRHARAQKPVVRFLQQIIRKMPVAGPPPQISPDRACRAFIECSEAFLIHLKRIVGFVGSRLK